MNIRIGQGYDVHQLVEGRDLQKPKLAPHIPAMRANIAADLGIQTACVNIKGKTNEKLGYLGRMEAIEAQAAVLLMRDGTPAPAVFQTA